MRKYWEMTKSQMKVDFTYSAWYWAGTFSAILRLVIIYYFWHAVYENKTELAGFDLSSMITYMVLAMILESYVSGVAQLVAEYVQQGTIAVELMRPYDLMTKLIAFDLGEKLSGTIRQMLPMVIITILFLHIEAPASWEAGILFAASAIIGIMIGTVLDLGIGLLSFWTVNVFGLRMLRSAVIMFFAGGMVPISLFPDWLQTLSHFLPFQSMVFVPVSIYTGHMSGTEAYTAIGLQAIWLIGVFLAIRFCWNTAIRRITIFGG